MAAERRRDLTARRLVAIVVDRALGFRGRNRDPDGENECQVTGKPSPCLLPPENPESGINHLRFALVAGVNVRTAALGEQCHHDRRGRQGNQLKPRRYVWRHSRNCSEWSCCRDCGTGPAINALTGCSQVSKVVGLDNVGRSYRSGRLRKRRRKAKDDAWKHSGYYMKQFCNTPGEARVLIRVSVATSSRETRRSLFTNDARGADSPARTLVANATPCSVAVPTACNGVLLCRSASRNDWAGALLRLARGVIETKQLARLPCPLLECRRTRDARSASALHRKPRSRAERTRPPSGKHDCRSPGREALLFAMSTTRGGATANSGASVPVSREAAAAGREEEMHVARWKQDCWRGCWSARFCFCCHRVPMGLLLVGYSGPVGDHDELHSVACAELHQDS
jgi:hypothetical protein